MYLRINKVQKYSKKFWNIQYPTNSECLASNKQLPCMRLLRVGHDGATSLSLFTFMHWRRKWQPTPVFLPGESQGQGSLVGCRLWGHVWHRVRHDWSDLAAAAACMQKKKKKQENMIYNKKNQSTETDLDMIEIMELRQRY